MIRNKHTQFGWVITMLCLLVGAILLITAISIKGEDSRLGILLFVAFVLFTCLLLFHSLTTIVTDEHVRVYFGGGIIRKKIPLDKIIACCALKNKFVLGWGIRFGSGYILWNVSGLDAIELTLKDKKWKFRIGTDKPEELSEAISYTLKERQLSKKAD